jgi:uncharacterized protein (TIGR03085 family)
MVLRFAPLVAWADRVQHGVRDTTTWDALVQRARSGPPALLKPFDREINTVEYFVHHEDLRRAQPGWEPRTLDAGDEAVLWRQLRRMRWAMRSPVARLEAPGQAPLVFPNTKLGGAVRGPVGELALWVLGRKDAARVETTP